MMASRLISRLMILVCLLCTGALRAEVAEEFLYQGQLRSAGEPVTGVVDLAFELFDDPNAGAQIGATVELESVEVADGLFTVVLDFGPDAFTGGPRWLRISVDGAPLSPRQPVTPSPQAIHAGTVSQVGDSALSGTYSGELAFTNPENQFTGAFTGDGAGLTGLDAGNIASGVIDNARTTATAANVANTLVMRDAQGDVSINSLNANNLTTAALTAGSVTTSSISGNGSAITNLNASNISSGVIGNARTTGSSANVANTLVLRDGDGNISVATMNAGSLAVSGGVVAESFSGSHSGNGSGLTNLNASSLTTGTIPSARLSGTYSNTLTLSNSTNFFKGNGAGLSNLNAENIVIGTLAEERLPPSVLDKLPDSLVALSIKGSTSTFEGLFPQSVAMANGLAYVTATGGTGTFMVYDVNDSSGPTFLGGAPANSDIPPAVSGSRLYVGSTGQLLSFDISNPSSPTLLESGIPIGVFIRGVAATESHVFVINSNSALFRFNVTGSGLQSAGPNSVIGGFPIAIAASGSTTYVVSGTTSPVLEIFTASDPGVVGSLPVQVSPRSIAVSGDHVFVVNSGSPQRLDVFNVSNPASPSLVGSVGIASSVSSVAVSGNYAYVAHDVAAGTVRVYDVSNPSSPFLLDSISLGVRASSLAVSQGTVSVLSSDSNTLFALRTKLPLFNGIGSGLTNLNAANITTGNLNIARLPTGGNWSLSSLLNIASNTLVVNPANSRVGISTSTPDSRLHVAGGSTASLTTGSGFLQVGPTNGANLLMDGGRIIARDNGATGLMRINTTGLRVGSGTDPFATLHVESSSDAVEGVGFRVRFGPNTKVRVTTNGGTSLGANVDAPENGLRVAGESYLLGNVGVGTTAPGAFNLAVNGSAAKTGGGSWSVFSDVRLKHDIQPLAAGVLDRVLSLNGYRFQYHDEAVEKKLALPGVQTGLIAQEVAEVFPDWVEADDEGYLFVTERGTTALFVEAMRELRQEKDAEIAELRAEGETTIATLRAEKDAEIAELRERMLQLEKLMGNLGAIQTASR